MNKLILTIAGAAIGFASCTAFAADPSSDGARKDRMDRAYEDYRNTQPGPAARTESSVKRGANRAGNAIKRTGTSVKEGTERLGHKAAEGMRRTGKKISDKVGPTTSPNYNPAN